MAHEDIRTMVSSEILKITKEALRERMRLEPGNKYVSNLLEKLEKSARN